MKLFFLNLDLWFRSCRKLSFKDISYLELWQPLCLEGVKPIMLEGIMMRNISVKLFRI